MHATFIGIDNGVSGALAAILSDGTLDVQDMPLAKVGDAKFIDALALEDWFMKHAGCAAAEGEPPPRVTFEQGQKQPTFGTKGNFSNGYSFGVVKTVLEIQARKGNLAFQCVNPRTWQKLMFQDIRGIAEGNTKGAAIEICRRCWPTFSLVPKGCRSPRDGWADALCMAAFSSRTMTF